MAVAEKDYVDVPHELLRDRSLGAGAKFLYILLLQHWDRNGYTHVPHKPLAEVAGVEHHSIRRWLLELMQHGYIREIPTGVRREKRYEPVRSFCAIEESLQ